MEGQRSGKAFLSKFLAPILIVSAVLAIGACSQPSQPSPPPAATAGAAQGAKWWDKYGQPQYGGTLTAAVTAINPGFDVNALNSTMYGWYENSFFYDQTVDRSVWGFKMMMLPKEEYTKGALVESWDWTDPQTLVLHIRKGVHFQNKPPVNGRELTADDIVYHYDRQLGTGNGFDKPGPWAVSVLAPNIAKVTAQDKYTAVVKFKQPARLVNFWTITDPFYGNAVEPKEVVDAGANDWKNVAGTGAFILKDYVAGSSVTMTKNPDYWGYDERNPQNRLPYFDSVQILQISDPATMLSALRTGKVDLINGIMSQQAQALAKSNPEIVQSKRTYGLATNLGMRVDKAPFTDIRVRKALQMAVDIPTIDKSLYGGDRDPTMAGAFLRELKGWGFAYEEWPQALKDEYTYNPAAAKKLLADAGFPNGFKTNIVAPTNADMDLLQAVKGEFADIGVDMEIRTMDPPAATAFWQQGKHDQMSWGGGAYQMAFPYSIVLKQASKTHINNYTHNDDDAYEALYNAFLNSKDFAEAQQRGKEADKYIIEHHWSVFLLPNVVYDVWQPYLKGYAGEMWDNVGVDIPSLARNWIDQNAKKAMGR